MGENLLQILPIIKEAGKIAMSYFNSDLSFKIKPDNSEISEADLAVNNFISSAIKEISNLPVIAEESDNMASLIKDFWLVDPIDGTNSFINKRTSFVINIALIENSKPSYGFIYQPVCDKLYYNLDEVLLEEQGKTTKLEPKNLPSAIIAAVSYKNQNLQLENFLKSNNIIEYLNIPSGVKFGLLLEGKAHIYPRFGRTMEWDIAAGHALLRKHRGGVFDLNGQEITYGKAGFENPNFIALNNKELFNLLNF